MLKVMNCRWRHFFVCSCCLFLFLYGDLSGIPLFKSHAHAQDQPLSVQKLTSEDEKAKKIVALVIDDFGNNMKGTAEMMSLKIQFSVAVMPFLPTTHRDAEWAHSLGHNVLVHLPMEPIRGLSSWLGPGAITISLSDAEIRKRVNAAIDDVPFAVGMNNHMGSKATADTRVMKIVLEICHERGLFFLDSHTNYRSVVSKLAEQLAVRTLDNHIFLDDFNTMQHINKQLGLVNIFLQKHDECVVIGHVGPSGLKTAAALSQVSLNPSDKYKFVSLLQMLSIKEQRKLDAGLSGSRHQANWGPKHSLIR